VAASNLSSLGDAYLNAADPLLECCDSYPRLLPESAQRFVFLAKPARARELTTRGITGVPVGRKEAQRFGYGYIAQKGWLFELYARSLALEGESLWHATIDDNSTATFMNAVERGFLLE
jgi:hypothetical protein